MWRERIAELASNVSFGPPGSERAVRDAEVALQVAFPESLRGLLLEADGVEGEFGLGLIWPAARICGDNVRFRKDPGFAELYMPFQPLLFFADAGNGDQFAFVVLAGAIPRPDVFVWDHENDSRTWVAPSLETYLQWWLSGRIEL